MLETVILICVLVMSVVIHEVAHGYVAFLLGDRTAELAGRLTLNPFKHLNWLGSVVIPGLLLMLGGFVIGWAKPVPYNPYNLRGGRTAPALVAAAGPGANVLIALIFALGYRLGLAAALAPQAVALVGHIIALNLMLAVFNLVPVPPLDGSKILFSLLPFRWHSAEEWLTRYQFVVFIIAIFVLLNTNFLQNLVGWLFGVLVG